MAGRYWPSWALIDTSNLSADQAAVVLQQEAAKSSMAIDQVRADETLDGLGADSLDGALGFILDPLRQADPSIRPFSSVNFPDIPVLQGTVPFDTVNVLGIPMRPWHVMAALLGAAFVGWHQGWLKKL
jgi:hypothetical protein